MKKDRIQLIREAAEKVKMERLIRDALKKSSKKPAKKQEVTITEDMLSY